MKPRLLLAAMLAVTLAQAARADLFTKAGGELMEQLVKKFGREVAEEGAERLAGRIASAAARHGDDVLSAVRRIGPKALSLADDAGKNAPRAMRFLTEYFLESRDIPRFGHTGFRLDPDNASQTFVAAQFGKHSLGSDVPQRDAQDDHSP